LSQALSKKTLNCDIAIVGGGMVGGCLALGLMQIAKAQAQSKNLTHKKPLTVALIDPHQQQVEQSPGFDARAIALSWSSCRILQGLDIWPAMKSHATAINHIHVSDKGHSGITRLNAEQEGLDYLGQVIELTDAGKVLHQALSAHEQTTDFLTRIPEALEQLELPNKEACLSTESYQINANLVLACDGNHSKVRTLAGIKVQQKPYQQMALVTTIATQLAHQNRAFERFTETGPLALLPLSEQRMSMVWMLPEAQAKTYAEQDFSDQQFTNDLQACFGQRLGKVTKVGKRIAFPLSLMQAEQLTEQRVVLLGNAAQSLHPIAGQGFNLGLRDVATFLEALVESLQAPNGLDNSIVIEQLLNQYQTLRETDRTAVVNSTDFLARLFANPSPLVSLPRNLMLHSLNCLPAAKSTIARQAMGLNGWQPRLVRGLSLTHSAPNARHHLVEQVSL
jgi:2-octaprenyl-6-methoxyphenol hydroxylase